MTLTERQQSSSATAQQRFAESTRATSFSLNLGIMEIRLLRDNDWRLIHRRSPSELAALQRLVDKGLMIHEQGKDPQMSEQGSLVRELLVLSRHITTDENPERLKPDDILEIMRNGLQWYQGGGNGWLAGVHLRRSLHTGIEELRIKIKKPDYNHYPSEGESRKMIIQEFAIARADVREVTKSPDPPQPE